MYLWNGLVHVFETWKPLELNNKFCGMKRLMEEAATRNVEAIHYLVSAGIWVG